VEKTKAGYPKANRSDSIAECRTRTNAQSCDTKREKEIKGCAASRVSKSAMQSSPFSTRYNHTKSNVLISGLGDPRASNMLKSLLAVAQPCAVQNVMNIPALFDISLETALD